MISISILMLITSLAYLQLASSYTSLYTLTKRCQSWNESKSYCGVYPPDCELSNDFQCQLITHVMRYDIPCIKMNLRDPYIQILCNKRFSTYLVSMLRLLAPSERRSCPEENRIVREDTEVDPKARMKLEKCFKREYVAVSFSPSPISPDADANDQIYYVCVADESHVTTWIDRGRSIIKKMENTRKYLIPYQNSVLITSGLGVYWENVNVVHPNDIDFGCEFVISVEDSDLEYQNPIQRHKLEMLKLPVDQNLTVTMAQGLVVREIDNNIVEVKMEELSQTTTLDPIASTPAPQFYKRFQLNSSKANGKEGRPLRLSYLEQGDIYQNKGEQLRKTIEKDDRLFEAYWKPLIEVCKNRSAVCFTIGGDSAECFQAEKATCVLIVALQFKDNFTRMHVRMIVDDWSWGGFAFSLDRRMEDDVGYFCQFNDPFVLLTAKLNLRHGAKDGNDTNLVKIIDLKNNVTLKSAQRRYCEWIMPSIFIVKTDPLVPGGNISLDLINEEYFIQMAVGNNLNENVAYHTRKSISSLRFSKQFYLTNTVLMMKSNGVASKPLASLWRKWNYLFLILFYFIV